MCKEVTWYEQCTLTCSLPALKPLSSWLVALISRCSDGGRILTSGRDDCLKLVDLRTHDVIRTYTYVQRYEAVTHER